MVQRKWDRVQRGGKMIQDIKEIGSLQRNMLNRFFYKLSTFCKHSKMEALKCKGGKL